MGRSAAMVAAGLLLTATPMAAQGQDRTPAASVPSITVEGDAVREVMPDVAVITLGVVTEQPTAAEAVARNRVAAAALVEQVKAEGIAATDVRTVEVSLTPLAAPQNKGKTKIFQASNRIAVKTRAIVKLGDMVGRLVASGANELQGIDFLIGDPRGVLDMLRAEATRDARAKAQIYAEAAGVKLGRLVQIAPDAGAASPVYRAMKAQAAPVGDMPIPVSPAMQVLESSGQHHVGTPALTPATQDRFYDEPQSCPSCDRCRRHLT